MPGNPLQPQGTLNRLRGSVQVVDFPELNVTASFLGRAGIVLTFGGQTTLPIDTMTGGVQSPEPYQHVTVAMNLVRTLNIAALYQDQILIDTLLGDVTVTPDVGTNGGVQPWDLTNCAIGDVQPLTINGTDAGYVVTITGYYLINASLFDAFA